MAEDEKIGIITEDNCYEEKNFEWKVTNFFSVAQKTTRCITSPYFSFANASFYLRMYPKSNSKVGFSALYLTSKENCEYSVEYDFALKRLDGAWQSVEALGKNILKSRTSDPIYFKHLEIQERQYEASSDVLCIPFKLRRKIVNSGQPSELKESKLVELIKLDTLSCNLKDLLANKESCDTILQVQDREYKAHRAILIARSPIFAAMFLHETSEKQTGLVTIPDCDPESFEEFLIFLYCGKLHKPSSRTAIHLYETANKYEVLELETFCVEYLICNLMVENICDVVIFAEKYEKKNLLNAAQSFFNKNLNNILQTSEWDYLVKNNYRLSKRLLTEMSLKMKAVE